MLIAMENNLRIIIYLYIFIDTNVNCNMETSYYKNFRIPVAIMWALVVVNYWVAISFVFYHSPLTGPTFISGFKFGIIIMTWLLFLADALVSRIYNRSFWLIALVVTPLFAYPFYLVQRKKLLNMAERRGHFDNPVKQG